jgi:DivIVA domain-containing protein
VGELLLAEVRFTERRGGYDPDEVDTFLRRVGEAITTLQQKLDRAEAGALSLGAADDDFTAELMTVRFTTARQGYDQDQVDNFLARVAEKLGDIQVKLRSGDRPRLRAAGATVAIFRVVVPVGDIEDAERYYSAVLRAPGERVSPGRHYFDCGGVILVCFDCQADGDSDKAQRPNPDHLYLAVEDLEGVLERVRREGSSWVEDEIRVRPWGERSFYCGDPWGNPLCFVEEKTTFTGGTW